MKGRLLAALGVVAVLGLAFLLGHEGQTPGAPPESTGRPADYGYVALDTELTQTGDDGQHLYTLTAARIEQNPGSGDISARTLTLHYAPDKSQNWTLAARTALQPGGGTVIHMQGDVQVRGKPQGSALVAQLNTQRLDYDMRTQEVTTRDAVRFTWAGQQMDARGLTANLKRGQVSLEADVHGRFSP